jgi:uncharacterized membrane protein YfcA
MLPPHPVLLLIAAVLGGAMNSVAGGGGFIVFPALIFAGLPPIHANATNTVALWPASVASAGAYRGELRGRERWRAMLPLFAVTFIGAIAGALLLLHTPQATFMRLVPWLLLGATLLFAFGGKLTQRMRQPGHPSQPARTRLELIILQLIVAVYIGYFGAGAGMLVLALFTMMGMESIHTMNAFKSLIILSANGVAVVTFILAGAVVWPQALLMIFGAIAGGYGGAWYAQKLDQKIVRYIVIVIGAGMTIYFFWIY